MPSLPDIYVALFSLHGWEYANLEVRHDNTGPGNAPAYVGMAQDNASLSDPAWIIARYYYDGPNGTIDRIRFSKKNQVWDNRASIFT